jgi:hypothetical protein
MSIISRLFGQAAEAAPLPFDPQSPEGLAARWVRWAAATGATRSPIADVTGLYSDLNQPADVWFLAGTFGGDVRRSCPAPADRPIFLPAFCYWVAGPDVDGTVPTMRAAFGGLKVDGREIELDVYGTSVPFEVVGARGNTVTGNNRPAPATAWGYCKRLDPLSPGDHLVKVSVGADHGFLLRVAYYLTVR